MKKIIITGASSGIGRYLAGRFSGAGHQVWGSARSAVTRDDESGGTRAAFRYSPCDVSVWEEVGRWREEVGKEWGAVDAIICCSGIQAPVGPAMEVDPLAWSCNLRTNLDGTYFPIRAFFDLLQTGAGVRNAKVVCFSGGGAASPRPNFSAYACAKAAVVRLVENLSAEWAGQSVDINAIAPGAIRTSMTEEVLRLGARLAGEKELAAACKLSGSDGGSLCRAGDLVEYLISPGSDGISGRLISAPWDPWRDLGKLREELGASDIYTLRRITPEDRHKAW